MYLDANEIQRYISNYFVKGVYLVNRLDFRSDSESYLLDHSDCTEGVGRPDEV